MVEKFEIGIVIAYVMRNTILGESLINWIDQLYVIIERPPAFDLDAVVIEKIHEIINKYNLTKLRNIVIDLQNLNNLQPMFDLIMDARLNNPPGEDLTFINYVFGLEAQQTITFLTTNLPNVDLSTPWDDPVNQNAIQQDLNLVQSPQAKLDALNLIENIDNHENYLGLQERTRVVPAPEYQTRLREVFDASHKFSQKKFLNVSLSDLLTSRTNFTYVVKNFATGLYNFFKGYMSSQTVEIPREVNTNEIFPIMKYRDYIYSTLT
jgi:hypothetical protein